MHNNRSYFTIRELKRIYRKNRHRDSTRAVPTITQVSLKSGPEDIIMDNNIFIHPIVFNRQSVLFCLDHDYDNRTTMAMISETTTVIELSIEKF